MEDPVGSSARPHWTPTPSAERRCQPLALAVPAHWGQMCTLLGLTRYIWSGFGFPSRSLPHPPQPAGGEELHIWKQSQLSRFKEILHRREENPIPHPSSLLPPQPQQMRRAPASPAVSRILLGAEPLPGGQRVVPAPHGEEGLAQAPCWGVSSGWRHPQLHPAAGGMLDGAVPGRPGPFPAVAGHHWEPSTGPHLMALVFKLSANPAKPCAAVGSSAPFPPVPANRMGCFSV